ncbi:hypothetical protein Tco_1352891 [Tanacetum coccineum]
MYLQTINLLGVNRSIHISEILLGDYVHKRAGSISLAEHLDLRRPGRAVHCDKWSIVSFAISCMINSTERIASTMNIQYRRASTCMLIVLLLAVGSSSWKDDETLIHCSV